MEKTGTTVGECACYGCWNVSWICLRPHKHNTWEVPHLPVWWMKECQECFFAWCCIKWFSHTSDPASYLPLLNWATWQNSCVGLTDAPSSLHLPPQKKFVNHLADLAGPTSYLSVTFAVPVCQAYATSTCREEWTQPLSKRCVSWEPSHYFILIIPVLGMLYPSQKWFHVILLAKGIPIDMCLKIVFVFQRGLLSVREFMCGGRWVAHESEERPSMWGEFRWREHVQSEGKTGELHGLSWGRDAGDEVMHCRVLDVFSTGSAQTFKKKKDFLLSSSPLLQTHSRHNNP